MEPPAGLTNTTKVTHVPVHLRSFKLPAPRPTIAPKVTQALAELGATHARLVMPTRENSSHLESLLDATTTLIETKKAVDRVEQDIRVIKARLGISESEGADKESSPMDVDESKEDKGGEREGRAQSIVSARSGRGRKQVRCFPVRCFRVLRPRSHVVPCRRPRLTLQHQCPHAQGPRDKRGDDFSLLYASHIIQHFQSIEQNRMMLHLPQSCENRRKKLTMTATFENHVIHRTLGNDDWNSLSSAMHKTV